MELKRAEEYGELLPMGSFSNMLSSHPGRQGHLTVDLDLDRRSSSRKKEPTVLS